LLLAMNAESSIRRDRLILFCFDKSFLRGLRSNRNGLLVDCRRHCGRCDRKCEHRDDGNLVDVRNDSGKHA
jgi:hypothetical protein